jgi:hypothetical protein
MSPLQLVWYSCGCQSQAWKPSFEHWDQRLRLQMKDWLSVHVWQASGWAVILARVPALAKACEHVLSCHEAWSITSDLRISVLGSF